MWRYYFSLYVLCMKEAPFLSRQHQQKGCVVLCVWICAGWHIGLVKECMLGAKHKGTSPFTSFFHQQRPLLAQRFYFLICECWEILWLQRQLGIKSFSQRQESFGSLGTEHEPSNPGFGITQTFKAPYNP